ncbi:MAG TPA: hypothetical protein VGG10_05740 [Rhizomicrobium sp.]|jgi:hypothetical protein
MRAPFLALVAVVLLTGCTRHPPPQGRWEGTYDTAEAMVAARVEIDDKGNVRITAPNAEDVGDNEDSRAAMRQNLAAGLATGWNSVEPRPMDFDGHVFRKPGGIAPQMIWDAKAKQMSIVVYLGVKEPIRFKLQSVDDFSQNPWPN